MVAKLSIFASYRKKRVEGEEIPLNIPESLAALVDLEIFRHDFACDAEGDGSVAELDTDGSELDSLLL